MAAFAKGVFINCPFDAEYRQLMLSMVFTIKYLGFTPRLALQNVDSTKARLSEIIQLIQDCQYGIHDLSRIKSTKKNQYFRLNMPFELGLDYGCRAFGGKKWAKKKLLVLEKKKYEYLVALSDLAGSDIEAHGDQAMTLVKIIRNWITGLTNKTGASSHSQIWFGFNEFTAYLEKQLQKTGHEPEDYETVPIPEVMRHMDAWFKLHAAA